MGQPLLGWFPQHEVRRRIGEDMKELEQNLKEALKALETKCSNSHCFEDTCKGECSREYNYQALKVIRNGIEQVKRLNKPITGQNDV